MKKKNMALLKVERGINVAATASSAAAAGRSALLNPKQASSSGSSIIDAFLNKQGNVLCSTLDPVHTLFLTCLMLMNHRMPISMPLVNDMIILIEVASCLQAGLYQWMTQGMVDQAPATVADVSDNTIAVCQLSVY
jgi:hypothetical protein